LDLREREIAAKEREVRSSRLTPLVIAVFAASIGLFANVWVAYLNNRNTLKVERQRAQSNLILEASRGGNAAAVCKNLVFFVGLRLIDDDDNSIRTECKSVPKGVPTIPAAPTVGGTGYGVQPYGTGPYGGGSELDLHMIGSVVDANTGFPIEGAKVTIGHNVPAQTDITGGFPFPKNFWTSQDATEFDTTIEKEGYETAHLNLKTYGIPLIRLKPNK